MGPPHTPPALTGPLLTLVAAAGLAAWWIPWTGPWHTGGESLFTSTEVRTSPSVPVPDPFHGPRLRPVTSWVLEAVTPGEATDPLPSPALVRGAALALLVLLAVAVVMLARRYLESTTATAVAGALAILNPLSLIAASRAETFGLLLGCALGAASLALWTTVRTSPWGVSGWVRAFAALGLMAAALGSHPAAAAFALAVLPVMLVTPGGPLRSALIRSLPAVTFVLFLPISWHRAHAPLPLDLYLRIPAGSVDHLPSLPASWYAIAALGALTIGVIRPRQARGLWASVALMAAGIVPWFLLRVPELDGRSSLLTGHLAGMAPGLALGGACLIAAVPLPRRWEFPVQTALGAALVALSCVIATILAAGGQWGARLRARVIDDATQVAKGLDAGAQVLVAAPRHPPWKDGRSRPDDVYGAGDYAWDAFGPDLVRAFISQARLPGHRLIHVLPEQVFNASPGALARLDVKPARDAILSLTNVESTAGAFSRIDDELLALMQPSRSRTDAGPTLSWDWSQPYQAHAWQDTRVVLPGSGLPASHDADPGGRPRFMFTALTQAFVSPPLRGDALGAPHRFRIEAEVEVGDAAGSRIIGLENGRPTFSHPLTWSPDKAAITVPLDRWEPAPHAALRIAWGIPRAGTIVAVGRITIQFRAP